ncbi:MAG: hypothetical protein KGL39_12980 [Patescibacteria group bacterium]|nr:hypothetical protein [Patescibacteria group bacterium]
MRSVSNWLKRNWIAVVALVSLCMSTVVAAPSVFNGSLVVPVSGTVTDNNAANGTVPVVNASHVYAYATPNPTASNACLTVTTPVNALSPVIGIGNSGTLATGCGGNGTGVPSLSAGTGLASSGSWAAQTLGLAAASSYTVLANNTGATATPIPISAAALAGMLSGSNGCPPQVFTATGTSTDTSGTYTTPMCNGVTATVLWIRVAGGGGGGGGSGTAGATAGGNGDASTFGTSLLTANAGNGGGAGNASTAPTINCTGNTASGGNIANYQGACGGGAPPAPSAISVPGGIGGGTSVLGQGGQSLFTGGFGGAGSTGQGCGAGGGGGSSAAVSGDFGGAGGSGAGYTESIITAPSATYAYTAGKWGAAGGSGTSGSAGGHGAPGCIIVVASWGTL